MLVQKAWLWLVYLEHASGSGAGSVSGAGGAGGTSTGGAGGAFISSSSRLPTTIARRTIMIVATESVALTRRCAETIWKS